eukprot:GILK01004690.1.p1 GENE.GILK01004690.1~~GILK01004690.1.p1  ORF type:complete len:482 (-),score=72.43 GILK01004690.1:293-1681(-)
MHAHSRALRDVTNIAADATNKHEKMARNHTARDDGQRLHRRDTVRFDLKSSAGFVAPAPVVPLDPAASAQKSASIYSAEIHMHCQNIESRACVPEDFLSRHPSLNAHLRARLVDWLVEVHLQYRMEHQTLFLCVSVMDRFLQRVQSAVEANQIQLVGVTSLLIASKFEDTKPPTLADGSYMTQYKFTKEDVGLLELDILKTLQFSVSCPTSLEFVKYYTELLHSCLSKPVDELAKRLAVYLCELALLDLDMLSFKPSAIAAAALQLALTCVNPNAQWQSICEQLSGHSSVVLVPCVESLRQLWSSFSSKYPRLVHLQNKYSTVEQLEVAKVSPLMIPVSCPPVSTTKIHDMLLSPMHKDRHIWAADSPYHGSSPSPLSPYTAGAFYTTSSPLGYPSSLPSPVAMVPSSASKVDLDSSSMSLSLSHHHHHEQHDVAMCDTHNGVFDMSMDYASLTSQQRSSFL